MAFKEKKIFKNISSKAWEHPADKAALSALRQTPGLNELLQKVLGFLNDKRLRLTALASSVRVTPTQYAELYRLHKEACLILDTPYLPELYVSLNPALNANVTGVDKPFIMLSSALVGKLPLEEIQFIIAHEIGHCLSGHALYKTILKLLMQISLFLFRIPIAELAFYAIIAAFMEWDRKSELSADRAGLLVLQEPEVAYQVMMKLAGGTDVAKMDINEFFKQAAEYDKGDDMVDGVYKIINSLFVSHPFPVLRLTELKTWVDSGGYGKILDSDFVKRVDVKDDLGRNFKEAADQFKEDLNRSEDPLNKVVNDFLDNINDSTQQVSKFFEDFFNRKQ